MDNAAPTDSEAPGSAADEERDLSHDDPERQETDRDIEQDESGLTGHERGQIKDNLRLSAITVFSVIRREGEEELHRPAMSLWFSGIAAGIGISTSVFAQGLLHQSFQTHPQRELIAAFGYAMGFVLVVLSRLQLFTENTLTAVLPLLAGPNLDRLWRTARLWTIVLAANLVGTFLTALLVDLFADPTHPTVAGMLEVSRKAAEAKGFTALLDGVPAGFFIAAFVWMLPSSKGFEIFVVALFAWLISAGGFAHVVAGSTEMFLLVLHGELPVFDAFAVHLAPTLVGNVIGGTCLFALLAFGQIKAEIDAG